MAPPLEGDESNTLRTLEENEKIKHNKFVATYQNQIDYPFVNISNPEDITNPQTRRFVRQQVQRKHKKPSSLRKSTELFSQSGPYNFPFINLSNPSQASSARAKRFVRQQVQLQYHKQSSSREIVSSSNDDNAGKPKARIPGYKLPQPPTGNSKGYYQDFRFLDGTEKANPHRQQVRKPHIGAKIDHSKIIYPVPMDREMYGIVEYLHADEDSTKIIPAFRQIWFGMVLRDPASFLQQMGTALNHMEIVHGINYQRQVLIYKQRALVSVNERLRDTALSTGDGVIATILSFLTYDHLFLQLKSYRVNKAGLLQIIQLRGGIETLEGNAEIRLMILWDEVCGAMAFDYPPTYGLPKYHIPPLPHRAAVPMSRRFSEMKQNWRGYLPEDEDFIDTFCDLYIINSLLKVGMPEVWNDQFFLGLRINPIILRLIPSYTVYQEPIEVAVRLAALIYLADIRLEFMAYHGMGYHFIGRLKHIINEDTVGWEKFEDLKLWVLVIGGMKATEADQKLFIKTIRRSMRVLNLRTWNEVLDVVSSFPWLAEVYGVKFDELGQKLNENQT